MDELTFETETVDCKFRGRRGYGQNRGGDVYGIGRRFNLRQEGLFWTITVEIRSQTEGR